MSVMHVEGKTQVRTQEIAQIGFSIGTTTLTCFAVIVCNKYFTILDIEQRY